MDEKKNFWLKKVVKRFALWGVAALLLGIGIGAGVSMRGSAVAATSYDNLRIFAEVLTIIQNYYVEEKTSKDLSTGAIKGLLRTLDPHSSYMDVGTYKNRKEETEGKFGGVGIEITIRDLYITVVAPIADTPAERKGIMAGDKIIKIGDVSTKNMDLMDGVKLMRGEIGTDVTLTLYREETNNTFSVTITRALIKIKSVKYDMINGEMGYLRILSFSQQTANDVDSALEELENRNFKSLVLDLRNNPGGLLDQSVKVADMFLEKGKVIVSTRGRTSDQNTNFVSRRNGRTDFPMVVLVNAGSASASEIVAGAMKDLKRALIVGTQTFGKGSVQTIRQLSDGSGLTLTTARYYTPSGKMIHGIGIEPDIKVKFRLPKKDEDGERFGKTVREKDLMKRFKEQANGGKHTEIPEKPKVKKKKTMGKREIFNLEKDNQLQRAVDLLKSWNLFHEIQLKKAS